MKPGRIERDAAAPLPQVWAADRWWSRLRGLLMRPPLAEDGSQALLITPCASVHTCGMRYPLDVVFLDRQQRVIDWRCSLQPWRFAACRGAAATVEFHAGALARLQPRRGERWCWHHQTSDARSHAPKLPAPRRRMEGQAMVELLIVAPVLFFLILATIQAVLLYRIKSTLDYAALMAARAGAVSGLSDSEMKAAFAKGMAPLYAHQTGPTELVKAYAKARLDLLVHGKITVINPTRAAWEEFKERQYNGQYALPNDTLAYRSHAVGSSGVNVQDANLLKIKVTYNAPLVVPFVGWVLGGKSQYLKAGAFESSPLTPLTRRLRIESYAIVRMQSPIYQSNSGMLPGRN